MKRLLFRMLFILYTAGMLLPLSGCSGLLAEHKDIERIRPIRTMGFDISENGSVSLGISSGTGPEGTSPVVMKSTAPNIESAITRLQDYSSQDELYYAHVQFILLGAENVTDGLGGILAWVEQSPAMRMDTPLFLLKGSAADTVVRSMTGDTDITERLEALEREELLRGQEIYTLRQVASSLAETGSALCLAIEAMPEEGTVFGQENTSDAIIPSGYAVLREGAPAAYLSLNETLGTELLAGGVVGERITVDGNVLVIYEGSASASGQWLEDGTLAAIRIEGSLKTGLLEQEPGGEVNLSALEEALSDSAADWLRQAVSRSQELSCDFLGLKSAASRDAPKNGRDSLARWDSDFSSLPVIVSMEGEVLRSYELTG